MGAGEEDSTESDIGAMGRSDIGNAGDGDVRLVDIGGAREAVSGAEMSEAISDVYEASKPETMTGDAGVWCISGS